MYTPPTVDLSQLETDVAAILVDTGTTLPASLSDVEGVVGGAGQVNVTGGIGYFTLTGAVARQTSMVLTAGADFDGSLNLGWLGYVGGSTTGSVQWYRNGVGVGSLQTESSGGVWVPHTQVIAGWSDGDTIEFWAGRTAGASFCYCGGLSISAGGGWSVGVAS